MKSFFITICLITLSLVNVQAQTPKSKSNATHSQKVSQTLLNNPSDCNGYFVKRVKNKPVKEWTEDGQPIYGNEEDLDEVYVDLSYKNGKIKVTEAFVYRDAMSENMSASYNNGVLTITDNDKESKFKFVLKHVGIGLFKGVYYTNYSGGKPTKVTLKRSTKPVY